MPFRDGPVVDIKSRDFWFNVVEMSQQNWALIDADHGGRATVFLVHDGSGVFDRLTFETTEEATKALVRNGFRRFAGDPNATASWPP